MARWSALPLSYSLRNLAARPPYFHNGSAATLADGNISWLIDVLGQAAGSPGLEAAEDWTAPAAGGGLVFVATPDQLQAVSQTSCGVLNKLGSQIQWLHSYVTENKIYCVYSSPNEELIREHARQGGFPANRISPVRAVIDPTTAENF